MAKGGLEGLNIESSNITQKKKKTRPYVGFRRDIFSSTPRAKRHCLAVWTVLSTREWRV